MPGSLYLQAQDQMRFSPVFIVAAAIECHAIWRDKYNLQFYISKIIYYVVFIDLAEWLVLKI